MHVLACALMRTHSHAPASPPPPLQFFLRLLTEPTCAADARRDVPAQLLLLCLTKVIALTLIDGLSLSRNYPDITLSHAMHITGLGHHLEQSLSLLDVLLHIPEVMDVYVSLGEDMLSGVRTAHRLVDRAEGKSGEATARARERKAAGVKERTMAEQWEACLAAFQVHMDGSTVPEPGALSGRGGELLGALRGGPVSDSRAAEHVQAALRSQRQQLLEVVAPLGHEGTQQQQQQQQSKEPAHQLRQQLSGARASRSGRMQQPGPSTKVRGCGHAVSCHHGHVL